MGFVTQFLEFSSAALGIAVFFYLLVAIVRPERF